MRLFGVASLAALVCTLATRPAHAQMSIEASPLRIELSAQPGTSHTQAVTVTNPGSETVRVRTTVADWYLSKDGAPQFEPPVEGRPYAAASWVRFAPPEFLLGPGKQGIVRFTVTVPSDVEPGGYRSGLLFEFLPETPPAPVAKTRQVIFRSRIATLVYVHIGQPTAAIELTDLQVRSNGGHAQIVAALKNTGRRSVRTKGTLVLYDRTGVPAARLIVPDVPVLPESERELAIGTDTGQPLVSGTYRVELKLDVGMAALLVGETTLRIER